MAGRRLNVGTAMVSDLTTDFLQTYQYGREETDSLDSSGELVPVS